MLTQHSDYGRSIANDLAVTDWTASSGAGGARTWHVWRTWTWTYLGVDRCHTESLLTASGQLRRFKSQDAAKKAIARI